jgi:hypothetical protein
LWILAGHTRSVEPWAVWIDARAEVGVTLPAVCLLVTGRATGQILPRGAPVLKEPERLRIVKHGASDVGLRGESDLAMAGSAERFG